MVHRGRMGASKVDQDQQRRVREAKQLLVKSMTHQRRIEEKMLTLEALLAELCTAVDLVRAAKEMASR